MKLGWQKTMEGQNFCCCVVTEILCGYRFYSSNNYVTLNNLITREKSEEFFSGSTCGSGFSKKKIVFSVRKPTGKTVALIELLRMWEDLFTLGQ